MFDFGFSELTLIGAVALVVLGPEKLPVVARTAGQFLGKAQRMVQQVKNDIEREAELSELKKIQEEAKSIADDLTKTVKGQMDSIEGEVKSVQKEVNAVARDMTDSFEGAKSAFSDLGGSSQAADDMAGAFDKAKDVDASTSAVDVAKSDAEVGDNVNDFYDWYSGQSDDADAYVEPKTFDKRYKSGPSIDELAEEIERLKTQLGERTPQFGGNNRKFAMRARTNRPRIYR